MHVDDDGTEVRGFARRVMSCTYSFWDIIDDLVMRKVNDSDATKFAELCRWPSAQSDF